MTGLIKMATFSKVAVKRQKVKTADTFIIIYGLARSGKTTLGFKILLPFLKLKRLLYSLGKSEWLPEFKWSKIFKKYFSSDAEDMTDKIKENPVGSFNFVDEGLDVVSWHDRLTREQKNLIELLQKSGKKCQLTILLIANFGILTKEILARAHYLIIIPREPSVKGNVGLVFRQYKVPFLAEKNPFGLNKMFKDLQKNPQLFESSKKFIKYLKRSKRLVGTVTFGKLNQKLYDLYDRLVKDPSIIREKHKNRMVNYPLFYKLKYSFNTLLYNLKEKDGKTIAEIEKLLIDKFGTQLVNRNLISNQINRMTALEVKPILDEQEIIEPPVSITEEEDIELEDSLALEEIESHVDASNKTEETKQQANTSQDDVSGGGNSSASTVDGEGNTATVKNVDGEDNSTHDTPNDSATLETKIVKTEAH